jgi:hypothetical protein
MRSPVHESVDNRGWFMGADMSQRIEDFIERRVNARSKVCGDVWFHIDRNSHYFREHIFDNTDKVGEKNMQGVFRRTLSSVLLQIGSVLIMLAGFGGIGPA